MIVCYFIPGVRHITGYFSGIAKIPYRSFALYAYTGALLWVSAFISLGKVLGPKWEEYHGAANKYLIIGGIFAVVVLVVIYLYRGYKQMILETSRSILGKLILTFRSLGRVKLLVAGSAVVFLGFLILMLGLIQDYLSNEFQQFDIIVTFLINAIFGNMGWIREAVVLHAQSGGATIWGMASRF